jgi:predicted flap endonuclease-1-like 5' DNA nuclease
MTMFLIQSAILIAIAFVTGCIIGCLLRRMFAPEAAAPATVATPAYALPKEVTPVPEPAKSAEAVPAPAMASALTARKPTPAPKTTEATKPEVAAEPGPSLKKAPAKSRTSFKTEAASKSSKKPTATGSKPAKPIPAIAEKVTAKPVSDKPKKPMATKLAKPVGGKPDNLTLINGIGNVIEKKLHGIGVFHFEQIAKWTKEEAQDASKAVGFPGRAMRENWMKEAAIFMKGGTTDHARKVEAGDIATSRKSTAAEKSRKK